MYIEEYKKIPNKHVRTNICSSFEIKFVEIQDTYFQVLVIGLVID